MNASRKLRARRGLATVSAIFMILLMTAALTGLFLIFNFINSSAQLQTQTEVVRSKEQIKVTNLYVENGIQYITITNTGTIDVIIRAIYKTTDGVETFIVDPSTYISTLIPASNSLALNLPSLLNLDDKVVAATENGVKSTDEFIPPPAPTPSTSHNPMKYIYGNLELTWVDFKYKSINDEFNTNPPWSPGWVVPPSTTVAWRVTIKNIGTRDITITENSSFTTVASGYPGHPSNVNNLLNWYLWSGSSQPQSIHLDADPTTDPVEVYFVRKLPSGNQYENTYSQPCVCMAFLTFFGYYEDDNSPYAQTVPFEAAITIS